MRKVLARCADPGVDQRIANRLGDGIEPLLLRVRVRMVEVEFVHELIERHRKLGWMLPGNACHIGQRLRALHFHTSSAELFLDIYRDILWQSDI